ncbi:unnamed protein product [Protopolystoma xenopodis]|uniref:Uncharacterized protein n=1 Tax=Protopolystoma xenopodis TaxID=117903 RepID=A0A448WVZ7_9PLAT|nr:unnamed protein product [Protopolystoma xenopodis]
MMRLYEAIDESEATVSDVQQTSSENDLASILLGADTDEAGESQSDLDKNINNTDDAAYCPKVMSSLGGMKRAFVAHVPVYTQQQPHSLAQQVFA